jgi:hypothetical protein
MIPNDCFYYVDISECITSSISNQTITTQTIYDRQNSNSKSRKINGFSSSVQGRMKKSESTLRRKEKYLEPDEDSRKNKRCSNRPGSKGLLDTKESKPNSFTSGVSNITIPTGIMSTREEETIHMPQGSQAAAAAAMLFHPQAIPIALNGTISHTSFPLALLNKDGRIGIYLPEARKERIAKFHSKRQRRTWRKKIKYDCRKKLADSRPRVKGRFVKSLDDGE